jgi:hypothetical protein
MPFSIPLKARFMRATLAIPQGVAQSLTRRMVAVMPCKKREQYNPEHPLDQAIHIICMKYVLTFTQP